MYLTCEHCDVIFDGDDEAEIVEELLVHEDEEHTEILIRQRVLKASLRLVESLIASKKVEKLINDGYNRT